MSSMRRWFEHNLTEALADAARREAIERTAAAKIEARAAAVAEVADFEALRELAGRIKQHTLDHLDRYLERFVTAVRAAGGQVHVARSAAEANRLVVDIARREGLGLAVKSKSMVSEEIGLNEALESAGLRVVETDLGEFIVQLDHDRPSHIVTPIIHKNRRQIAETFSRELGVPYSEDPETLTGHARRHLRALFRECDLGISGVNFGVAETGTLCLCSNEGNGRLTTTRPRVHIALMGIEKLVPRFADLAVFLKLLARSSTGQPITVYTSLITGPRREQDPDGPESLHVILLDNGRRRLWAGPQREVLRCIRCGACLNACPVYRRLGGHAYGSVYPGPIGKLVTPWLVDFEHYADLPQVSSLCGRCADVCPVKIDIPRMLVGLRREQLRRGTVPRGRRLAFRLLLETLSTPALFRAGQMLGRWLSGPWACGEWITRLPGPAGGLTRFRDLPRPARRPFSTLWNDLAQEAAGQSASHPEDSAGRVAETRGGGGRSEARPGVREKNQPLPEGKHDLAPELPETLIRREGSDEDLAVRFAVEAERGGMRVWRCDRHGAAQTILHILKSLEAELGRPPRVVFEPGLWVVSELNAGGKGGITWSEPRDDGALFSADAGLSGVQAAVAETGSLVCASGPGRWRGLSLIPPVHIALVEAKRIVPDLLDVLGQRPRPLPSALTLISGPSKTADIEGILIQGVHGPGTVHVVLVG